MIASAASNSAAPSQRWARRRDYRRAGDHLGRIGAFDAGGLQRVPRQIKPAHRGVLVEVAQNIGELQRAAEMMRERKARIALHAEHAHRQPPDRAGDAVAIKIERRPVRRADVRNHVHFHAVDDGDEVVALQVESAHRARKAVQRGRRRAA